MRSVVDQIDNALNELDTMDSWLLLYSAELNVSATPMVHGLIFIATRTQSMGDDIREIETQNRGLQILAQNQHSLITELDQLLVSIPGRTRDQERKKEKKGGKG